MTHEEFELINELLTKEFGLYFPAHKKDILEFCLRPRIEANRLKGYTDYYLLLQYNSVVEKEQLMRAVTNNETYFFRETGQFDSLLEHGMEELKPGVGRPGTIAILCAGCSSGEEAYTLNIYLKENQFRFWGFNTVLEAFDLDSTRIDIAKRAEYSQNSFRGMDHKKIEHYFMPEKNSMRELKSGYRQGVSFSWGNILELFTYYKQLPFDCVFCRNVLIYFSEPALHKAVENFARCLRPGGYLFLGHSESIIGVSQKFEPVRIGTCIAYRRVAT